MGDISPFYFPLSFPREEAIRAIEEEIRGERRVAEEVVQAMPAGKQERYFTMTTANEELLQELTVLQEELDLLITRKEDYDAELSHSHTKQEVVRLHETLLALQGKREAMEAEHKSSPQDERETLLKQVKEDNQEIASMDRQLTEIRERMEQITEQIRQLEQDSEEAQGECQQKYRELKRRDEEIDRYMESFEEVDTVTASELRNMQEVLVSKETEVVQSESTARGLTTESQRLQQDLEKVQQLEGKISGELSSLKERVGTMETELLTYRDLDTLRHTGEEKKKRLQEERVSLTQRRDSFKQLLEEMNQKYEALKTKLQENETHAQLANLERKWQHLEQNNFVMKESSVIASKSQESDYASVAKNVSQQVAEYNKSLIDSLQNNRS
ncbi:Intraflagellar transport protein 74 like [Dissostichus eleginoides]|uniref:Intraflagellar transport protein 74 like n=1 Tax=Dissostichus eleginoides TaxID=100907 RepID=A0AAD9BK07_DISEL|nr:Intraflagellar transport protein 74 like [Dissostichus eleginoides]